MPDQRVGPLVLALFGPTGVGKTEIALAVADRLRSRGHDPVAVSADALQVYRGLETLTGAADSAQRARLEHRLLSFVDVRDTFSVGEYARRAHAEIDVALMTGRWPLVVGGTGLYLQAALCDLDLRPPPPPRLRTELQAELEELGPDVLHARLHALAPARAAGIATADGRRIVRALEVIEMGQSPAPAGPDSRLWTAHLRHPTALFGLVMERSALYERIGQRVDAMVAAGAADEVSAVQKAGASTTARQALGFRQLLAGDVDAMRRDTRRYAKRQLTWLRKLRGIAVIDVTGRTHDAVADEIVSRG